MSSMRDCARLSLCRCDELQRARVIFRVLRIDLTLRLMSWTVAMASRRASRPPRRGRNSRTFFDLLAEPRSNLVGQVAAFPDLLEDRAFRRADARRALRRTAARCSRGCRRGGRSRPHRARPPVPRSATAGTCGWLRRATIRSTASKCVPGRFVRGSEPNWGERLQLAVTATDRGVGARRPSSSAFVCAELPDP